MDTDMLRGRESGIGQRAKTAKIKGTLPIRLGQHSPSDCPTQLAASGQHLTPSYANSRLGKALDIQDVAALIGCSPWNVRQRWIPKGLPHLRSGASGRLIFYEVQVVRWIERQQQGG